MKKILFSLLLAALPVSAFAEQDWCADVRETVSNLDFPIHVGEQESPMLYGGAIMDLLPSCDISKTIKVLVDGHEEAIIAEARQIYKEYRVNYVHVWPETQKDYFWVAMKSAELRWEQAVYFSNWQSNNAEANRDAGVHFKELKRLLDTLEALYNKQQ
ncbi:MAG: hypothetical protein OSB62_00855 [Alphaproteobacteria bacterium]|nr:hypothetical protein [Alphaproteobacteria bacterium]